MEYWIADAYFFAKVKNFRKDYCMFQASIYPFPKSNFAEDKKTSAKLNYSNSK